MFASALVGLREGLEASLVVSILVAFLVRGGHRDRLAPLWTGVGVAVGVSVAFGAFLQLTSTTLLADDGDREAFGGALSVLAVVFVTAMVFWMRRAARSMKRELEGRLDAALAVGGWAVALTGGLAVGREGLETATFFWSAAQAAHESATPLLGFALGIALAVALAVGLYRRAVHLDLARFFSWTGAGLVVVAAGVLADGVGSLQGGGLLPGGGAFAWHAAWLSEDHWWGTLLTGTLSVSADTTWLQVAVWVGYLLPVMVLFVRGAAFRGSRPSAPTAPATPSAAPAAAAKGAAGAAVPA